MRRNSGYNCANMDASNSSGPIFIAKQPALERLARTLMGEAIIAVDTESNSLYAYQEQVCLIQFSTASQDFLVDPLALNDLYPLGEVFGDAKIEKVFHAAEYDVICLKRDFGFEFANLFDTMLAARILGRDEIGLGSILENEFDVHLDKRFQRANWGERPLPPNLLNYAQHDTHYLIPLRHRLRLDLEEKGLWALAQEDFNRLCSINGRPLENRVDDCWRVSGAHDLHPQNAAVLMELCRYRNQVARAINRPLFKVMSDHTLVEIAVRRPSALDGLRDIHGMTPAQIKRHGTALLEAVQRGLKGPGAHPPRNPRPDERYLDRLERLRTWRKEKAKELGVNSDVVMPRELLMTVAEQNPGDLEELADILRQVPWRLEKFGGEMMRALSAIS
jgi:ribonuclease D